MAVTELEMAKSGEFLREYGKQYFVVCSEALGIGRVKWNMVPIGKKGQDSITFYLTTERMLALCEEILSGEFKKKIDADSASAYPSAYRYVTGDDGALRLNIGGAKVGCRIQMQDNKNKMNYTMAVSVESMYTMARKYLLCCGLTPVASVSYYASIINAFNEGRAERAKFTNPSLDEIGHEANANAHTEETMDTVNHEAEQPKEEKKPAAKKKEAERGEMANYTLNISGTKTVNKERYIFSGTDKDGNKVSLVFKKEDADALKWFKKFEDTTACRETPITIYGEKKGEYVLYLGPEKK